jgi:Methylmalonyl Co-A mutase-associated GTPase MeaB
VGWSKKPRLSHRDLRRRPCDPVPEKAKPKKPCSNCAIAGEGALAAPCANDSTGRAGFDPALEPRYRIGVTSLPGAGKSSLIGVLPSQRVNAAGSLAVLAIDPSSPVSRGSTLGDSIRMGAVSARRLHLATAGTDDLDVVRRWHRRVVGRHRQASQYNCVQA